MLRISPIPCFSDNYIWCIHNSVSPNEVYVVDPGDALESLRYLTQHNLTLCGILVTHWHPDHVGGIDALTASFPSIPVIGPKSEKIPMVTHCVQDGDTISVFDQNINIIATPGHTLEHIVYFIAESHQLFCGDTLFSAGCGRMFEGTPSLFTESLKKIGQLPDDTLIYCAHEYTLQNLEFAKTVESNNQDILNYYANTQKLRAENTMTLPSTLGVEKKINPFLRLTQPNMLSQLTAMDKLSPTHTNTSDTFKVLREWKDNF
jgi:hydroxyacylglutathione hydrolase